MREAAENIIIIGKRIPASVKCFFKKWFINPLYNMSLRKRLLLTNVIFYVLIVITVSVWIGVAVYRDMAAQGTFTLEHNFDQTQSYLNTKLLSTIDASGSILLNSYLNDTINNKYDNSVDLIAAARSLRSILRSVESNNGIAHASIYVEESWSQALDNDTIRSISLLEDDPLFSDLLSMQTKMKFIENGDYISLFRIMRSTNNYRLLSFILRLDMPKKDFIDILDNTNPTSDSTSFLVSSSRSVIATSGSSGELLTDQSLEEILLWEDGTTHELTIEGKQFLGIKTAISNTNWNMIILVPFASFMLNFHEQSLMIAQIALLIITLTLLLFSIISVTVTRRILQLCEHIKEAKKGDLRPINAPVYKDEIGLLYSNYNDMIGRIQQLLVENYEMGRSLKNAEVETLQAQINPHFLYNTLDMISWFSLQGKSTKINEVVYSLARFYKISLSRGLSVITINEELEHADCYINIQMNRFNNKITYHKDIDPDILQYSIPKITLQPIVENAIFHGILENPDSSCGIIRIKGRIEDNIIHIMVADNGRGMEPEKALLNNESTDSAGSHYGLKNIILRIQLLYGSDYGISIESSPGHGTIVHINLPAIKPEDKGLCDFIT